MKTDKKASHTPGPREAKQLLNHSEWVILWPDTSKGGVHKRRLDENGKFAEPDANLIAAAPELLAALEAIYEEAKHAWNDCDVLRDALAAIAKAKGE